MLSVDLNADIAEECGDDAAMLEIVTSANLACGMHAGNLAEMLRWLTVSAEKGIRVGAHPSYPDRANFGRISMAHLVGSPLFETTMKAQLDAFSMLQHLTHRRTDAAALDGHTMPYLKAHGALYNDAALDADIARRLVTVAKSHGGAVMHQPGTWVQHYAEENSVPFIAEVFADRAYQPDGTLAPRSLNGAVLHDANFIAERVVRMVTNQSVVAIDGSVHQFAAVDSVCVHGDTPGAVQIAHTVRRALESAGITVAAPASVRTDSRSSR